MNGNDCGKNASYTKDMYWKEYSVDAVSRTQQSVAEFQRDFSVEVKSLVKSPLRYPGGKTRAVKKIMSYFPLGLNRLCSPFLGGGSIELGLACRGVRVFGYDTFQPLVHFWKVLLDDPVGLSKEVLTLHPLPKTTFYSLQQEYWNMEDQKKKAAVFYALNRSSFSGTTFSGGMSPKHPRFTKSSIQRLAAFEINHFSVECLDFKQSLRKHAEDFLYLDPPYANGEKLYGNRGDTHQDFDHRGLADVLARRGKWVLSYNDHPRVRCLYEGHTIMTPTWTYGMSREKKSKELLIFSKDLVVNG